MFSLFSLFYLDQGHHIQMYVLNIVLTPLISIEICRLTSQVQGLENFPFFGGIYFAFKICFPLDEILSGFCIFLVPEGFKGPIREPPK